MAEELTDGHGVYVPAYGPVRRAIEYGLFYFVVDRCTRLLVALLAEFPQFAAHVPTLTTALAVALWSMLILVVVFELRRQRAANPRNLDDLAALRPSSRRMAAAGGAVVLGAGIVAHGWPTVASLTSDGTVAIAAGQEVVTHVTSEVGPAQKTMGVLGTDLGVLVTFGVGFVLLAYGLDRLLLGVVREAWYRWLARSG